MLIDEDLVTLRQRHYPGPPASAEQLAAFESRWGFKLDPDLTAFYRACNGARLFKPTDSPYRFLSLGEIMRGRVAVFGEDEDALGPRSILAVCYVEDGNYVGIDISARATGFFPVLDLFHETFPKEMEPIADSFGTFLHEALRHEGRHYWLMNDK